MCKEFLSLFLLLASSIFVSQAFAQTEIKPHQYNEYLPYTTIRIEVEDHNLMLPSSPPQIQIGTSFIYGFENKGAYIYAVVTNRHVIRKGDFKGDLFKLFLSKYDLVDSTKTSTEVISFQESFENQWIEHPDPSIDLAIFPLPSDFRIYNYRVLPLAKTLIPTSEQLQLINPIEDVFMIGYPSGLYDDVNNLPLVRTGTTATSVSVDFKGKREFVIDAACYHGSSGSPIFLLNRGAFSLKGKANSVSGTRFHFLGILYGGPQFNSNGIVVTKGIPTDAISMHEIPMNLGYCIKSSALEDFTPILLKMTGH